MTKKRTPLALRYGLGGRAERALSAIGVMNDDDLEAIDVSRLKRLRSIGDGTIHEIRTARTRMLKSRHGSGYSDALTLELPAGAERHQDEDARNDFSLSDEAEFDEAEFARRHRLNGRAVSALRDAGVRSDRSFAAADLEALAQMPAVGAKTMDLIRRARVRMAMSSSDQLEQAKRLSQARKVAAKAGLRKDAIEMLVRAGVGTLEDLQSIDLEAAAARVPKYSRRQKAAFNDIRAAQDRLLAGMRGPSMDSRSNIDPGSVRLAFRHGLKWRAAKALSALKVSSDDGLASINFGALARVDGIGRRTIESIRAARTDLMKSRHGADYEDEGMLAPEAGEDVQFIGDAGELSPRALKVLEALNIDTNRKLIDLDFAEAARLKGVGRETIAELRSARSGLLFELAGVARKTGTALGVSRSGKGLLVEFSDGERLWLPKAKCTVLEDGKQVSVPRGLITASREWMNHPPQPAPPRDQAETEMPTP
ncbi:DNA-directed RNA polymerase subunit alpha C-terminal domain-containing protein [Leisingera caerulea]|uniref:hypothetical protein n=1 Tax=Leisingera caerulea TaxID=506591 RepID=UPI00041E1009|nr:hypothetical protein [Leisingera caerulea]